MLVRLGRGGSARRGWTTEANSTAPTREVGDHGAVCCNWSSKGVAARFKAAVKADPASADTELPAFTAKALDQECVHVRYSIPPSYTEYGIPDNHPFLGSPRLYPAADFREGAALH